MKSRVIKVVILMVLFSLVSCKKGAEEQGLADKAGNLATKGPNGEDPVSYDKIKLTKTQEKTVSGKKLKAAILMHTSSDFSNALIMGAKDTFKKLNIEVVVTTDAEMDAGKQRSNIETALALKPDIIVTLILDPVSGAVALKPAIEKGVKVVLISNLPRNFKHNKDYAAIVTDDLFGMGRSVAEMMGDALNKKGKVALIYHDANYYVTNQRDQAVYTVLKNKYPGIEIVSQKGIANQNDGEMIASAIITQHPDIKAIYAPWDTIAEGVVSATRAVGRKDIKVFTMDIGANNGLDLAKGGNVAGIVADLPYDLGSTLAKVGALSVLGEKTPPFITVPAIKISKKNIVQGWKKSLRRMPPKEVMRALKK
jgi:ribose transport system substrate-binding protein